QPDRPRARRRRTGRRPRGASRALQAGRQRPRPRGRRPPARQPRGQSRGPVDRDLSAAMRIGNLEFGIWNALSSSRFQVRGRTLHIAVAVVAVGCIAALAVWLRRPSPSPPAPLPARGARPAARPPAVAFTDITQTAGIAFAHQNGADGQKLLPETMGGGVVFFDYNNDGRPDLLFVDSRPWPWSPHAGSPARSRLVLYRNAGGGRFADVPAAPRPLA